MNERIRQLVEQANDHANHLDKIGVDDSWQNIFNQKFAQLIVRECAIIADLADENNCECIGGNILTHFGVNNREVPVLTQGDEAFLKGFGESFTIAETNKVWGIKE